MLDVVRHVLAEIPGPEDQIIVLLQPTQPLRQPKHVTAAIDLLRDTEADSVVSVVELPRTHSPHYVCRVVEGRVEPWFAYEGATAWPDGRQRVTPAFTRDGTVYAFWRQTVSRYGSLYGEDVRPLIIPPEETCELDTEADWQVLERRLRG
jgi:CMP-N,N'-diacetyllegionaminic acid synthase